MVRFLQAGVTKGAKMVMELSFELMKKEQSMCCTEFGKRESESAG
jgi:hypothetical protein